MKHIIQLFLLTVGISQMLTAQTFENIDVEEAMTLIAANSDHPAFTILDVRTAGEYLPEHIEEAFNRNFYDADFEQQMDSLNKERIYLIYCKSGNRSGQTFQLMQNLGFQTVYNMLGGMNTWNAANLPTTDVIPAYVDLFAPLTTTGIIKIEDTTTEIFPNPANHYLNILPAITVKTVKIFNISGGMISEITLNNSKRINIDNLSKGSYLLVFFTDNNVLVEVKRLIKE